MTIAIFSLTELDSHSYTSLISTEIIQERHPFFCVALMSERPRLTGTLGGYLVTLLRQGWPRVGSLGPHSGGFWRSPKKRPYAPLPMLHHSHSSEVLPSVQREPSVLQFVPVSSDHGTGHHWEEPGSVFSVPSSQVFIYSKEILPSLFFTSSLTLSSCVRCFLVTVLNGPLLDSLHWLNFSPVTDAVEKLTFGDLERCQLSVPACFSSMFVLGVEYRKRFL